MNEINVKFVEIYHQIDELLNEYLSNTKALFNSLRSRFLYIANEKKLPEVFIKCVVTVCNLHFLHTKKNYLFTEQDLELINYVYSQINNVIKEQEIDLTESDSFKALINKFSPDQETLQDKYECQIVNIKTSLTNKNHLRMEIETISQQGDIHIINLWLDTEAEKTSFARRFDLLLEFYEQCRNVIFYNLSFDQERGFFFQNKETYFVIEPDFLIDITSIAECFNKEFIVPSQFFLKFVRKFEQSPAIIKGNFVNYLLDSVVSGKPVDIKQDFRNELMKGFIKNLNLSKNDISEIIDEVEDKHYKNIKNVYNEFKDKKITLEPSFNCPDQGLQGRLDALVETENDPDYKTIIELKAGRYPGDRVWVNNVTQVVGYNIILNSLYGKSRRGNSFLLFSKDPDKPMRNILSSAQRIQEIAMCRNIIINDIFSLISLINESDGSFSFKSTLMQIFNKVEVKNLPHFSEVYVSEFCQFYENLKKTERDYFNLMLQQIIKEFVAKKLGYKGENGVYRRGYSSLWKTELQEKINNREIIRNLKFKSHENGLFTFVIDNTVDTNFDDVVQDINSFRKGDIIILYKAEILDNHQIANPTNGPVMKAVIKDIFSNQVIISFRNDLISSNLFNCDDSYFVEYDVMDSNIFDTSKHIIELLKIDKTKRDIYLGMIAPRFKSKISETLDTYDRIMQKMYNFQDYLLIQGPPGTGKTSKYLINIVKQHFITKNSPIVILTFTNRACEEICTRLTENFISYKILGTRNSDDKNHISTIISDYKESKVAITDYFKTIKEKLQEIKIFVSTVANFQMDVLYYKNYINLDTLIVDEASQLLENQLIGILSYFNRFVLIGDHFQLPAVSTQKSSFIPDSLKNSIGLSDINESLFGRLYKLCENNGWFDAIDLLKEHYRVHKDIERLINPFYNNKLATASLRQTEEFNLYKKELEIEGLLNEIVSSRTVFINTSLSSRSFYNEEEADIVAQIIDFIYNNINRTFKENTLGVICPWKLQCNLIMDKIKDKNYHTLVTIDTVERFQGSERDIIIYSTAISNDIQIKKIQSLTADNKVDRKLNVAISRAREQFIMLGNENMLNKAEHYKNIINLIKNKP